MHAWMDASLLREFNKQSCTRGGSRSSALRRVGLTLKPCTGQTFILIDGNSNLKHDGIDANETLMYVSKFAIQIGDTPRPKWPPCYALLWALGRLE